jgi:hypothetical protein
VASIANHYDVGCTEDQAGGLNKPATSESSSGTTLNPVFQPYDTYTGQQHTSGGGNRLSNYNGYPDPNQYTFDQNPSAGSLPGIVTQVKIMANTTAVGGGGVIRAIVPANLSFAQYDHFTYNDQNVVCVDRTNAGLGSPCAGQ